MEDGENIFKESLLVKRLNRTKLDPELWEKTGSEFAIQFLYKQGHFLHFYSCCLSMCYDRDTATRKSEKPRCAPTHGRISKFPKGRLSWMLFLLVSWLLDA